MDTIKALTAHIERHEKLCALDIIKFLYQGEFGCGHLIPDFTDAHERFCAEWDATPAQEGVVIEPLSPAFCRINFAAAKAAGYSRSMVLRMFFESAAVCGTKDALSQKLRDAIESAKRGELPFSADTLIAEIEKLKAENNPTLSHTAEYRAAYAPAYRVVKAEFCFYMPLFVKVFSLLSKNAAPLIVIDGMAAAGKTTLGTLLSSILPCNLIHADSFFLPPDMRNPVRMSETGGNIHYERLYSEVIANLAGNTSFEYRIFDCHEMDYTETARVIAGLPTVLEGSYSSHFKIKATPDITVFLKTDAKTQMARIAHRNGKAMLKRFAQDWVPAENLFFGQNATEENSSLVFET